MGIRGQRGNPRQEIKYTEESIQKALWQRKPLLSNPQFEMLNLMVYAWESDYLAISKAGYVYEAEIKISHADFLNEAKHKADKMRILRGKSTVAEHIDNLLHNGTENSCRPNYFYYVCPEGIIAPDEVPVFAGLLYIIDGCYFRWAKPAPRMHDEKHSLSAEYLRDKFHWAAWNWVRRCWNKKVQNIAPQTVSAYERALADAHERISDLERELKNKTS